MKGKHKSVDKNLKHSILWVESLPAVSKVVLGFSEACRHKYPPGHIKIKMEVDGGIKANAYSGKGVTDIFIRVKSIDKIDEVKDLISDKFNL